MRWIILNILCGVVSLSAAEEPVVRLAPPADGADAGDMIRQGIARAAALGSGARLELAAGQYLVSSASDANWFFVVGEANNLTIAGQGKETEIIFRDPSLGGWLIAGGQGITIRDLTIDYDPPPFTQGLITAVDASAGTFDLKLDAGYPSPDEAWFMTSKPPARQMGVAFDGAARRLKAGAPDFFLIAGWNMRDAAGSGQQAALSPQSSVLSTSSMWTMQLCDDERGKAATLSPGDRFALLSRRGNGAFRFSGVRNGLLENVTVHASPSLTVALVGCEAMTVRGLKVVYRDEKQGPGARGQGSALTPDPWPLSPALVASNGDGVHVQQNRVGPLIENCLFEGLCDDGVNVYAPPMIVREVVSPTQVRVTRSAELRIGDRLQVFDPRAGIVRGEPVVKEIHDEADLRLITFDKAVENLVAGEDHRSADTIYNLSSSGAGYVISGNHMRNHRRFGLLLRAGGGVVVGNKFENLGGWGICVGNEPTWPEGPVASDIIIRGNEFIGGGYSAGYGDSPFSAALVVRGMSLAGPPATPLLSNIRIEDNRFISPPGAAIDVRSARDVVIDGNRCDDGELTIND